MLYAVLVGAMNPGRIIAVQVVLGQLGTETLIWMTNAGLSLSLDLSLLT